MSHNVFDFRASRIDDSGNGIEVHAICNSSAGEYYGGVYSSLYEDRKQIDSITQEYTVGDNNYVEKMIRKEFKARCRDFALDKFRSIHETITTTHNIEEINNGE